MPRFTSLFKGFCLCLSGFVFGGIANAAQETVENCDNRPVYMVIAGVTLDAKRMGEYAVAIRDSGLYPQLGGYYVNVPRPIATFEGDVPKDYVSLIVRFPCLANARRFWYSKIYQETIRPLRLNPSAGDYLVTVYLEGELPAYLADSVGDASFSETFDGSAIQQIPGKN